MLVSKSDIPHSVYDTQIEVLGLIKSNKITLPNDMVAVVAVNHYSPRRWHIGWHFEPTGALEGDVIPFDDGTVSGSTAIIHKVIG